MSSFARAVALAALLAAAGCATAPAPPPGSFRFAIMGDTPYNAREEKAFVAMLGQLDREPIEFAIHVGDIKAGDHSPCTDALYLERKAELDRSLHPIVLTPGDNDWTDCRRPGNGAMDPIERLERMRQIFFSTPLSLGRKPMQTQAQSQCIVPVLPECECSAHPENRLWTLRHVTFVTLDVPGSHDNVGYDERNDREALCREEANRQWLEKALAQARSSKAVGLVIAMQADPWATKKPVYRGLLSEIADVGKRFGRPVLLVHGDTHTYRVDWPFHDAEGTPIDNITRLETYGSPLVGWVEVSVDPSDPRLFHEDPHLEAIVR